MCTTSYMDILNKLIVLVDSCDTWRYVYNMCKESLMMQKIQKGVGVLHATLNLVVVYLYIITHI